MSFASRRPLETLHPQHHYQTYGQKEQPHGQQRKPLVKIGPAANLIEHPTRVAVIGRSQMGKTTMTVELIEKRFPDMDRYFAVCPSFHSQSTFDPIRHHFRKQDVYEKPNALTFDRILSEIKSFQKFAQLKSQPKPNVLILFDDVTGLSVIHGNGKGGFANFAIQITHENATLIVIAHDSKRIDPNFRDSAENVIIYPSAGEKAVKWVHEQYNSPVLHNGQDFKKTIYAAWEGLEGRKGIGKHFLFIHNAPRQLPRFFSDFDREVDTGN